MILISLMPKDDIKFVLRVPRGMYGEVNRLADLEGASLNQWILRQMGLEEMNATRTPEISGRLDRRVTTEGERERLIEGGATTRNQDDIRNNRPRFPPEREPEHPAVQGREVEEERTEHDPEICQLGRECRECKKIAAQKALDA